MNSQLMAEDLQLGDVVLMHGQTNKVVHLKQDISGGVIAIMFDTPGDPMLWTSYRFPDDLLEVDRMESNQMLVTDH